MTALSFMLCGREEAVCIAASERQVQEGAVAIKPSDWAVGSNPGALVLKHVNPRMLGFELMERSSLSPATAN